MVDREYRRSFFESPAVETHNQTVDLLNALEEMETRIDKWLRIVSEERLDRIEQWLRRICWMLEKMAEHQGVVPGSVEQERDPESTETQQDL